MNKQREEGSLNKWRELERAEQEIDAEIEEWFQEKSELEQKHDELEVEHNMLLKELQARQTQQKQTAAKDKWQRFVYGNKHIK